MQLMVPRGVTWPHKNGSTYDDFKNCLWAIHFLPFPPGRINSSSLP